MAYRFHRHYTVEEARALLPRVQQWLERLMELKSELSQCDERLASLLSEGQDVGGPVVNDWVRILVAIKDNLREFQSREIQVKDLDRGLVDFPAIHQDREVYLCWELGDDDIEFWHDLDAGYAGRERL